MQAPRIIENQELGTPLPVCGPTLRRPALLPTRRQREMECLRDLPDGGRLAIAVRRSRNRLDWTVTPFNTFAARTMVLSTREARKHIPVALSSYITHVRVMNPSLYVLLVGKNSSLAKLVDPELLRGRVMRLSCAILETPYLGLPWMDRPVNFGSAGLFLRGSVPFELYLY